MWSGKLARRVIPALAFCAGTAAAADPVQPTSSIDSVLPGVIVSKPLFLTSDPPPVPPLTPLPFAPGASVEKALPPQFKSQLPAPGSIANLPALTLAPEGGEFVV